MLIGYVSDERFAAAADALLTFRSADTARTLRSGADGSVRGRLPSGSYALTIACDGFGSRRSSVEIGADHRPIQFRLLSERPVGYVWPKWIRSGGRGSVRVHSPHPYRLALARYGETIETPQLLGWFDEHGPRANVQVTPDGDYTQSGLDWRADLELAAPESSGLYFFQLEDEAGARFAFPWVVAPAVPRAPVAVLASTNTWNAYNNFGGRSNYINATGLPAAPTVVARTDLGRYRGIREHDAPDAAYVPLSFARPEPLNQVGHDDLPTDPIRGRHPCALAAAEWRLLAWLEREGFPYDLYADGQLHDGALDLDRYDVLVLSTHPEYWSRRMVEAVRSWVFERGGKLLYLGGNGLDCEVEFVGDSLRFLTENVEPGGRHENRLHRTFVSTASVLGVCFTEAGAMTGAPYRVVEPHHWAFAGTGLAEGDLFGVASLHERCPGGASGHETDKRTASTPPGAVLLARGLNPDDGGAELLWFETPSGGEVFAAGSIAWPSSILVDAGVSKITRNALERFVR
jgi:N,N-dimethylformamidase beta subunit-like, C-terminal